MSVIEVVERQVEAYNDRDLNRFAAAYADAILIYRMPSIEPIISGKVQLTAFYATQRFNLPGLHAEIVNRIVFGNKVIDHERIWGIREAPIELAAIYEVVGGLIARAWFFAPE